MNEWMSVCVSMYLCSDKCSDAVYVYGRRAACIRFCIHLSSAQHRQAGERTKQSKVDQTKSVYKHQTL